MDRGRFVLVRTTLLDYPGKVACAVFLPGCALRCPYCHNPELVDPDRTASADLNCSLDEWDAFLDRRAKLLGGVAVSGGEALLSPLLPGILDRADRHGLPVKLDSAGLWPDRLVPLLARRRLDYVAVDLKTAFDRYDEVGWKTPDAEERLTATLAALEESGTDYEIRTTVIPPLVDREILRRLAPTAARAPRWIWQVYRPGDTLDPRWSDLRAPDEDRLAEWAAEFEESAKISIR